VALISARTDDLASGPLYGVRCASAPPREGTLYVGRLAAEKGVVDLVRSWTGRDVLRILGDGPQLAEVVPGVDAFPAAAARVIADDEAPTRCRAFHDERHRSGTWVARTLALYAEVTGRAPTA
jgi:hypothetical protein